MKKNEVLLIQEVLNNIRAISAVNKEDMETVATRLNLDSSIQLNILWIVYCNEGVRITTIADWTFWHTSSIVIHVKKLMEKGLVTIEKSDQDGRVVNVYMTEAGKDLIRRCYSMMPSSFKITRALESMNNKYSPTITQLFVELLEYLSIELHGEDKVNWVKDIGKKLEDHEEENHISLVQQTEHDSVALSDLEKKRA